MKVLDYFKWRSEQKADRKAKRKAKRKAEKEQLKQIALIGEIEGLKMKLAKKMAMLEYLKQK